MKKKEEEKERKEKEKKEQQAIQKKLEATNIQNGGKWSCQAKASSNSGVFLRVKTIS